MYGQFKAIQMCAKELASMLATLITASLPPTIMDTNYTYPTN